MDPESANEATYFKTRSKKRNKKWEADIITLGSWFYSDIKFCKLLLCLLF